MAKLVMSERLALLLNEFSDSTIVTTFELVVVALETDGARKLLVAVNVKSVV